MLTSGWLVVYQPYHHLVVPAASVTEVYVDGSHVAIEVAGRIYVIDRASVVQHDLDAFVNTLAAARLAPVGSWPLDSHDAVVYAPAPFVASALNRAAPAFYTVPLVWLLTFLPLVWSAPSALGAFLLAAIFLGAPLGAMVVALAVGGAVEEALGPRTDRALAVRGGRLHLRFPWGEEGFLLSDASVIGRTPWGYTRLRVADRELFVPDVAKRGDPAALMAAIAEARGAW